MSGLMKQIIFAVIETKNKWWTTSPALSQIEDSSADCSHQIEFDFTFCSHKKDGLLITG